MAKTKEQKQKEAIERKRANLSKIRQEWISHQVGGDAYKTNMKHGKEWADRRAQEETNRFRKAAAEAQCDTHGNPFESIQVNAGPMYKLMHGLK